MFEPTNHRWPAGGSSRGWAAAVLLTALGTHLPACTRDDEAEDRGAPTAAEETSAQADWYEVVSPRPGPVVTDAAMNDLIRPSLYQSYHEILPVARSERRTVTADIVGPVCETGDFLARDREMAEVEAGDLLAVCTAGAYGFVQASNYNSRPRPPEVLVKGAQAKLIRQRESYEDLVRGEKAGT